MTSRGSRNSATKYADILSKALIAIFLLGSLGAGIELILLEHYAELAQLIPLGAMLVGLAVLGMWFLTRAPVVLRVFQVFMILFCLVGIVGIYLHYESNVEFELEMNPAAMGWPLIWASLTGAMPALAPGTMIHLGLVGLLYTYRHPVLVGSPAKEFKSSEDEVEHEE